MKELEVRMIPAYSPQALHLAGSGRDLHGPNDNTVAIAERRRQSERTRFRDTPAGCTVTIHEHLDGTVWVRRGPLVVGRLLAGRAPFSGRKTKKRKAVEKRKSRPLREILTFPQLRQLGAHGELPEETGQIACEQERRS